VSTTAFEIGPFRLDPDAGVLTRDGKPTALGPRAVAVLEMLVEHATEYVAKARIIDAAWPGLVVEEHNLAVQVNAIRRVLGQAGGERWIETLPRRGYRFVGPVKALRKDRAPESATVSARSNLPEPLTSFVGREGELAEVKRLLVSRRLLTITGVGGIGKTRLALQVGAEVLDAYRDGVWLVDFAPLADPELVPSAVAQLLGVRETVGKPLTETLCAHLKRRQLLLVLDNCEHLVQACAAFAATVLERASALTIIATSREPLGTAGEQIYALQPLSLPDPKANRESIAASQAVQLFVERARQKQPGFALTEARAPIVAQLCIHLDGIPLALELAAARTHSLSVEQIHARLGDRFRLLTSGGRAVLARQQTLRAALDWSFDLLSEEERAVLRRLAVFAGGFTLDAASAVTAVSGIDEHAVIDVLGQLVSRSLVVADTGFAARYRLLETVRAYALEKLGESGETSTSRRRHGEYFCALFERDGDDWWRMPDADWAARYQPEIDNVRTALDWALGPEGDAAIGAGLAGGSRPLWTNFAFSEGARRVEAAVSRLEPNVPAPHQAALWLALGVLMMQSEPPRVLAALERAVELYRPLGRALGLGVSLNQLGRSLARAQRVADAKSVLAEAAALLEHAGVPKPLGYHYSDRAFLSYESGDPLGAKKHYEKAVSCFRSAGSDRGVAVTIGNLADVSWMLGDLDGAIASLREAISLVRRVVGGERFLASALGNLAGVLTASGRLEEALGAAREGLPLLRDAGDVWIFLDHFALRKALDGSIVGAAFLAGYSDAVHLAKQSQREPNEARARERLHALMHDRLAPDELEQLLAEGAKMSEDEACRLALEE
jgi:predicted ATPase/DNA-binding winged helix-turn-helix (wHTH) protein/tetratricopeptide (TPR) repeat protein